MTSRAYRDAHPDALGRPSANLARLRRRAAGQTGRTAHARAQIRVLKFPTSRVVSVRWRDDDGDGADREPAP